MTIENLYALYTQHYKVDTDTRKIRKNSIYFALKGENFNGNTFAEEALKKGANYSIVDEKKYVTNNAIILVDNVLSTLQELAKYHREHITFPIIGLTGSNGKTTTKELINCALSKKFKTTATKGNLNNHIGVPLTILSFHKETEFGIVEMGANHLKEIEFLCTVAQPDYGYITNFGKAHLEGFGGVEGVIKGKSELYKYLKNYHKKAFVNQNDAKQVVLTQDMDTIFFSERIRLITSHPFLEVAIDDLSIKTHLTGAYNFSNISCAISVGQYFGVTHLDIKDAIASYIPANNRSQMIKTSTNTIILDAYNANPTSVEAALQSFRSLNADKKVLILGDMFELGKEATFEHQKMADLAIALNFKHIYLVGEHYFKTRTSTYKFKFYADLKNHITNNPINNATILIKGSRGMALERLLTIFN
ncbi:MAG: UDP-N-acetylmuramoyl-tripeptide--D-alanyl-D-alanine ligase [Flavobacteriaceae bacterium]|nr:MAG: UDP-N-acetylmuramoyl-tripeptide--D-alanyl-D-alanine ligase [Flavobacteriaceae bacterium]